MKEELKKSGRLAWSVVNVFTPHFDIRHSLFSVQYSHVTWRVARRSWRCTRIANSEQGTSNDEGRAQDRQQV